MTNSFEEKLALKRAKLEAEGRLVAPAPPSLPSAPSLPVAAPVTFMSGDAPRRDETLESIVNNLDIVSAYNQYAGKGAVDPGGRTESIKVRCPNPGHPDNNPSAWINTDKQVWKCGSCEMGGDKFDIAAWYFGMPVPGYKVGRSFHELRERIAASQGYTVQRSAGVTTVTKSFVESVGPDGAVIDTSPPKPPVIKPEDEEVADVIGLFNADDGFSVELDWRPLAPRGTFIETYMEQVVIDDVPEEYHFWNALLAISVALGRDVTMEDLRPVFGNLFICILGRTGAGKSKAKYLLDQLLHEALPFSVTDPFSKGVLRAAAPASAEALIWMFQKRIKDPSTGKDDLFPVRGIVDYSELSSLVGRASRSGSVLTPTLMQFYDMEPTVSNTSRTHGTEIAEAPYACAVTTSQPKSLKGLLTVADATSGFLNRWFFCVGKPKKRIPVGGAVPNIKPAIKPLKDIQGWASSTRSLKWGQDALDAFEAFFYSDIVPAMDRDETDMLSRLDLLCKKLVLLFSANMQHVEVQPEAIDQLKHMFPYLLECYGIPGAQVGNTLQEEIRTAILKAVVSHQARKGTGPSSRDINQLLKGRKYPLDIYNKTLKHMVDIDEISASVVTPEGGRGRPTTRYSVDDIEGAKRLVRVLSGDAKKGAGASS